jgi:cell division protein ZapA (FtsZ GTPase activity inhibitor)
VRKSLSVKPEIYNLNHSDGKEAKVPKATHAVDEMATELGEQVPAVDDKAPVASADNTVTEVIDGT